MRRETLKQNWTTMDLNLRSFVLTKARRSSGSGQVVTLHASSLRLHIRIALAGSMLSSLMRGSPNSSIVHNLSTARAENVPRIKNHNFCNKKNYTVSLLVEYRTRNWEIAASSFSWSTASNLEQVANLLCAQAINSASYLQRDGKWVVGTSPIVGYGAKA